MMFLPMVGCETERDLCPAVPFQPDPDLDISLCCKALTYCCQQFPASKEKDTCLVNAQKGGSPFCQSQYHEFRTFNLCQPLTSTNID
jgi:hypothetical protein